MALTFKDFLKEQNSSPYEKSLILREEIDRTIKDGKTLIDNDYRMYSESFFALLREARSMYEAGILQPNSEFDTELLESNVGEFFYDGEKYIPLDIPLVNEAEYQGKDVELNEPQRGGSKAYYVYVKNPDSGKVNKVEFGSGMKIHLCDKKKRKAFADRHNCSEKKDKTSAGYWSCRLPYYADQLGLECGGSYFW